MSECIDTKGRQGRETPWWATKCAAHPRKIIDPLIHAEREEPGNK